MAYLREDQSEVNARIVYWGIQGAGVSSNLRSIHDKLRSDHRGKLRQVPTRLDPTVHYELLPIELGQVNGLRTQLQVVAVPGAPEHAPTRKQLLDEVDGIVWVVDGDPARAQENLGALKELRAALASYGRTLEEVPLVVQYNKRDLSDSISLEALHRRTGLSGAAVFECVATQGTGVLQTLTTISKRVVRVLKDSQLGRQPQASPLAAAQPAQAAQALSPPTAPPSAPPSEPVNAPPARSAAQATRVDLLERAILDEGDPMAPSADTVLQAEQTLDRPWDEVRSTHGKSAGARIGSDFQIVSVGDAQRDGPRGVLLPVVLGNPEGESVTLQLRVQLDPLLDGDDEPGDG